VGILEIKRWAKESISLELTRRFMPRFDDFKDQLMIAFVKRLGRNVSIPVKEVDETGRYTLSFNIENGAFNFQLREKQ